jgi:hypothetical protein
MQPEPESGDDAEVAAPASQRPEQLPMVVVAGGHDAAVGQDDLGAVERVEREAVLAAEPADATPPG